MQLHQVRSNHRKKKPHRVGRGGKKGTTSGRGTKGQKSRAGARIRPAIKDFIKKLPKLRGRSKHSFKSFRSKPLVINLYIIDKKFNNQQIISPKTLFEAGLIRKEGGRLPDVKVLSEGKFSKKLLFKDVAFSKKAKEKIVKAGSTIK